MTQSIVAVAVAALLALSCKKEEPETVTVAPQRLCLDHPTGAAPAPFVVVRPAKEKIPTIVAPDRWRWIPQQKHKRLVLRVRFINGDNDTRKRVQTFADEWTQHAFVRFKYVDDPGAEIRIRFETDGISQTAIGSRAKSVTAPSTMRYGWLTRQTPDDEFRRTVLHEFGHALGLVHEHQNPASGIQWNEKRVLEDCRKLGWTDADVRANILTRYSANRTQFTPEIDAASIMIYPIPKNWTKDGFTVDWNPDLSPTDKQYIARLYPR